jgi:hypothetical protein
METLKITKRHVNAALQKSSWDFGNKILYDMCAKYPTHKDIDQIVAKIWLIGRSYAAAIERRKKAKEYNDTFYTEVVGPIIRKSKIDTWLKSLSKYRFPTLNNIEDILNTHGNLMNLIKEMTGMEKRSLTSKYLHFHKPNLFFIYDSRAIGSIRKLISPTKIKIHKTSEKDREYANFCLRCISLRDEIKEKFDKHLTPRELDKFLLNISD